ncbi:MAG: L,D-transpeptidase [Nanoarchaeota archaeon]|nr:L,D-transpeptidase [Nanoarchaeota archaeon]
MDRRTFLLTLSNLSLSSSIFAQNLSVDINDLTPQNTQEIKINLPSYSLKLFEDNKLKVEYPCRIGKPSTPTPIGKGKIILKRDQIIFRYLSGNKKGQIIKYSYLNPEQRTIKMPYEEMRGMDFEVNGRMTGAVIHSTTDYWTIGTAKSHGCIGVKTEDMLKLYNSVLTNPLPPLEITYQTLFFNPKNSQVTLWCDIYNKNSNNFENLQDCTKNFVSNSGPVNTLKIKEKLEELDGKLHEGNKSIQKLLKQGKDPKDKLGQLRISLPLEEILLS